MLLTTAFFRKDDSVEDKWNDNSQFKKWLRQCAPWHVHTVFKITTNTYTFQLQCVMLHVQNDFYDVKQTRPSEQASKWMRAFRLSESTKVRLT